MRKIKILLSMIIPFLILTYIKFSETVKISEEWEFMLGLTLVVLFLMFWCGFFAFVAYLIKDFVQWCKARIEAKRNK